MLWALAFVLTFIVGGITGLFLGNVIIDIPLSDTYFVVAHFHMVMGVSPIFAIFGGIYHWYPKLSGRMLNDKIGLLHFYITFIGTYLIYFPMHYLGFIGTPRRYYETGVTEITGFYPQSAHDLNVFITCVALFVGVSQLLFVYNLIVSLKKGKKAGDNPWGANSLEWRTPDTPPGHGNWGERLPTVHRWAYDYGVSHGDQDHIPQDVPKQKSN